MNGRKPFIMVIAGKPDSGKTTLILKLLPELKRKGYKIAVAKHCPCGFDLDVEGKDSWKFTRAGGEAAYLTSGKEEAMWRPISRSTGIRERLRAYFEDFDLVLMEGYNDEPGIGKIQVYRREIGGDVDFSDDVLAYVSDTEINTDKPVYAPDDIRGIISFLEALSEKI